MYHKEIVNIQTSLSACVIRLIFLCCFKNNKHNSVFTYVRNMMRELIEMRKRIVSGTLPADELSRISHQVADLVDYGNRLLNLDLNLRNEDNCQPADVRALSAVQVFAMVCTAYLYCLRYCCFFPRILHRQLVPKPFCIMKASFSNVLLAGV